MLKHPNLTTTPAPGGKLPSVSTTPGAYLGRQIVQHDDVGAGAGRFTRLLRGAALHLNLTGQAAHRPRGLHRLHG